MHRRGSIAESRECRSTIDTLLARGCEIALHGLWHLDEGGVSGSPQKYFARNILSAGEAEFAVLGAQQAQHRIEQGLAVLDRCSWPAMGFVPPAWQMSRQARSVLASFKFEYATSLGSMTRVASGEAWSVPAVVLSARSGWRRTLSIQFMRRRVAQLAATPAVRVALHPRDADYDQTFHAWRELLEQLLSDRRPVTKSAMCRALTADVTSK